MEHALILLADIRAALARGTRHYNKAGVLLTTEKEIVECLLDEGGVMFEPAGDLAHRPPD